MKALFMVIFSAALIGCAEKQDDWILVLLANTGSPIAIKVESSEHCYRAGEEPGVR